MSDAKAMETATLAGGCFWCLEAAFGQLKGVSEVVSGYMGGQVSNPTYQQVCGGRTGHAEVVQVRFDPAEISYGDLLAVFFTIHDPTTRDRQGNDCGTQYRSAIFFHSPEQQARATEIVRALEAERLFRDPIVTEIVPAQTFWRAEGYHQDYYRNNAYQPYCQFVVAPKVSKVRSKFKERLKP